MHICSSPASRVWSNALVIIDNKKVAKQVFFLILVLHSVKIESEAFRMVCRLDEPINNRRKLNFERQQRDLNFAKLRAVKYCNPFFSFV